ncbi:MAG: molybdenum cofactor guanylyltransferase MobA [Burkholderiaceae bacterium]
MTGVILAGGLGRRMNPDGGARNKGLLPFHGRPLASHVIERLAPQVAGLLINANRDLAAYRGFGWPVVEDAIPGFAGPLAGLHAGLLAAQTPYVVTAPCDAPLLPADLVMRLDTARRSAGVRVAVARVQGRLQPAFALLDRGLADALAAHLRDGGRRAGQWLCSLPHATADFDDPQAFVNLNTPQQLVENASS